MVFEAKMGHLHRTCCACCCQAQLNCWCLLLWTILAHASPKLLVATLAAQTICKKILTSQAKDISHFGTLQRKTLTHCMVHVHVSPPLWPSDLDAMNICARHRHIWLAANAPWRGQSSWPTPGPRAVPPTMCRNKVYSVKREESWSQHHRDLMHTWMSWIHVSNGRDHASVHYRTYAMNQLNTKIKFIQTS